MSTGIKKGDEVAIPGFTFAATPSAVILAGAKPVLIEIDENLNFDLKDLRQKCSGKMKAVIVVHMRGSASDIESVMEFAKSKNLVVIEDAVPVMGLKLKEKYLGTYGHFGAFSTQSDKSCNTGEGGLLVTNDKDYFAKAIILSGAYESRWKKHFNSKPPKLNDCDFPIYSFRMDNLRGALAYSQLKKLKARIKKLSLNYKYVTGRLSRFPQIRLRLPIEQNSILGDELLFSLPGFSVEEVVLFSRALSAEGIECSAFANPEKSNIRCFWHWGFLFPKKSIEWRKKVLPETSKYLGKYIDIPLSATLSKNDLNDLIIAIKKVLGGFDITRKTKWKE